MGLRVLLVAVLWLPTWVCLGQTVPDKQAVGAARALFEQANQAYRQGNLRRAFELFVEADHRAPSPELAFNIGRAAERMGSTREAILHFQRYLKEGKPTDKERKDLLDRIERLRELAKRQQAQALKPAPDTKALHGEARRFFQHGLELYRRGKLKGALAAFTAAQRFAEVAEVYYNLGVVAERLGRPRDAVDYYRAYLREQPKASDRVQIEERIRSLRAS